MGDDLIDDLVGCNLDQVFFLQESVDDVMSHPEIFEFQDVIKIKNKTTIFS